MTMNSDVAVILGFLYVQEYYDYDKPYIEYIVNNGTFAASPGTDLTEAIKKLAAADILDETASHRWFEPADGVFK